jgi:hypothetical protein
MEALKKNTAVTSVDLTANSIKDEGVQVCTCAAGNWCCHVLLGLQDGCLCRYTHVHSALEAPGQHQAMVQIQRMLRGCQAAYDVHESWIQHALGVQAGVHQVV